MVHNLKQSEIIEILEKLTDLLKLQMAETPYEYTSTTTKTDLWNCPNCQTTYMLTEMYNFCPHCGQCIDWSL